MDVIENVQKMRVGVDMNFLSAPLKKRALPFVSLIEVIGISDVQATNEFRQTAINPFRYEKMIMIAHKTPGMQIDDPFLFNIVVYETTNIGSSMPDILGVIDIIKLPHVMHEASAVFIV